MKASEVMTGDVEVVNPGNSLRQAAERMRRLDTGILPVCDGYRLVGVITDRDITVRATAEGRDPENTEVREAMTQKAVFCLEDEDSARIIKRMEKHRVRRMPVLARGKKLVGMISLADLAARGEKPGACGVLEKVSRPGRGRST